MLYYSTNAYIQHKAGSDWCLMVALHDSLSSAPHCTGEGAYLCYMSRPVGTEREAEKDVKTKQGIQLPSAFV